MGASQGPASRANGTGRGLRREHLTGRMIADPAQWPLVLPLRDAVAASRSRASSVRARVDESDDRLDHLVHPGRTARVAPDDLVTLAQFQIDAVDRLPSQARLARSVKAFATGVEDDHLGVAGNLDRNREIVASGRDH